MKNFLLIMMAVCLTFAMTSCDNGGGGKSHTHDWGEWEVTTDPTFITEGEETKTCKNNPSHTETRTFGTLPITSTEEWTTALSQISGKGNAGEYTLTIEGDIGVAGSTNNTFGTTADSSGLNVTLKGTGKLYLTSQGNIIRIGANQTLIINSEELTLQGLTNGENGATQDNNASVVYVNTGGTLELQNGTVSGNTASGYGTSSGGGVSLAQDATFTMSGGEISNNVAETSGGGVSLDQYATFTMSGGEISGNTSRNGGGVILNSDATFNMQGGEISGNTTPQYGGGVSLWGGGTFIMSGGEISNNVAGTSDGGGGGVYIFGGTFTMQSGEISGNTTSGSFSYGGGVYVSNGTFTMQNGEISGNTTYRNGGGVYVYGDSSTFTMQGGEISGNTAANNGYGGGVYLDKGTFRIVTGTIYGRDGLNLSNTANGGAALVKQPEGIAERGTFSGEEWTKAVNGDLDNTTNNTIKVLNGEIVPYP